MANWVNNMLAMFSSVEDERAIEMIEREFAINYLESILEATR